MATVGYPDPLTGKIYKLTLFINSGVGGWSDNVYVQLPTGGTLTEDQKVLAATYAYTTARASGLNGVSTIIDARYKDVSIAGKGQLVGGNRYPVPGVNDVGYTSLPPQVAIESRTYDITSGVRRTSALHGIRESWVKYVNGQAVPNWDAASLTQFKTNWFTLLVEGRDGNNVVVGTFAMRYIVKDPAVNPRSLLYKISINTDGTLVYHIQSDAPYPVGTKFRVVGPRSKCFPKLAGMRVSRGFIADTQAPPGLGDNVYKVFTATKPCCAGEPVLDYKPEWYTAKVTYAYAAIASVELPRIVNKKVGRPFGSVAGRGKGRCC